MTRFQLELAGFCGEFWKQNAENELQRVRQDIDNGRITIDVNGVARNCIGRAVMEDVLEKIAMVSGLVNMEETKRARDEETREEFLVDEVTKVLNNNHIAYMDIWSSEPNIVCVDIRWGDWKHDHKRADWLVSNLGGKLISAEVEEENGSDCYSALRKYQF